ncbi:hypothetical protein [Paenibacillus ferrarius]|uniref:hypothetical protein n=1 Tax=Paenibacillus ferrarius TaxID=1469647 RepID=UPI001301FD03|nr:hypothetical protein [Paenibacillus ferrarius]
MDEIYQLMKDLDWNNLECIQQNAITELTKLKDDDVILLAKQSNELCSKPCWDNAAVVK